MAMGLDVKLAIFKSLGVPVKGSFSVGGVYCKYFFLDKEKPLIFAFSNMGELSTKKNAKDKKYNPWGFEYILKKGCNVIAFSCIEKPNWFRSREFQDLAVLLGEKTRFFKEKLGYAGSMGGFGVSALSKPLGINRLLLMNPISTLNADLVPFETRFTAGKMLDWSTGFFDGADTTCSGYIVYDPLFDLDRLHANRYPMLEKLHLPGVGHGIPYHLQKLQALNFLFISFLNGNVDKCKFNQLAQARKKYENYFDWMLGSENARLTSGRKKILEAKKYELQLTKKELTISHAAVDRLRDLAVENEASDLELAFDIMRIAHQSRPKGVFIKNKLDEYGEKLKKK